jgi:hypothetical protein
MHHKKVLMKLLPIMEETDSLVELVEDFLDRLSDVHGQDGGARILKDLGFTDGDLETHGFNPYDVLEHYEVRQCEHCSKDLWNGHVILDGSFMSLIPKFYLCTDCFSKFYNKDVAEIMYNDGFQYYTEWEDGE